jgi:hypothetical protein
MLSFAGIEDVDIERLAEGLQIDKLREKYRDPEGHFFKGSAGALTKLAPGEKTMAQILEIEPMTNVATLGQEYLRCGRWQPLVFGSEVEDARWRKSLQTSVTGRAVFAHCAAVRHAMRASRCIVCCPAGDQFAG